MPRAFLTLASLPLLFTACDRDDGVVWSSKPRTSDSAPAEAEPAATPPTGPSIPETVTFNEHIQPILSEYCYQCHGPDAKTRYPEDSPLRIDLAEHAFKPRENGKPVIIKGDPDASVLVKLLHSEDPDTLMPPPESHKELDDRQIALLEKWIEQGAEYQKHWSLIPVTRPEVPTAGAGWALNPIDHFVHAQLAQNGLAPNPPEDSARLHRRLTLDLTGLPPTPAETASFIDSANLDPQTAIEAEARRLLATPASAEHFARHWLDAARYADTHGIHIDNYRAIWPYRDWVIRAFQKNMPFDQFTIEQIAGDLLPDPDLDQLVATGFHRCLPTSGEGGAIAEEYDAIYAQDRTNTTSAVWLGLTMGCAACHDHKFDPLSQRDNYSFNAFFRNTSMAALDKNQANHPPSIFVPIPEDREQFAILDSRMRELEKQLAARKTDARPDFQEWAPTAAPSNQPDIDFTLALHLPLTESEGPIRGFVDGEPRQWPNKFPRTDAPVGEAIRLNGEHLELGDLASFSRDNQVTYGGFVRTEGNPTGVIISRMDATADLRGWDLSIDNSRPASRIVDSWDKAANKITAKDQLRDGKWYHVMVTFDGSAASHRTMAIYVDGKKSPSSPQPNTLGANIESAAPVVLGARHGGKDNISGGKVALHDFRFYRRLLAPDEIKALAENGSLEFVLHKPVDQRTPRESEAVFNHYLNHIDKPYRALLGRKNELAKSLESIRERGSESLVMDEKEDTEPAAHILNRGVYTEKGELVKANTPIALPPLPEGSPRNRLGLAKWLVDPANPLTSRVTVNRLWQQFFGTGIVESTGDFGVMGDRPSHPHLLDWLAAEFMESGWDQQRLAFLIATSKTYQQSAIVPPEKLEVDPQNRLLSRGPRYRLDGEQLRDLALATSGLLSDVIGGPPVKPYQPIGIWEAVAMPQSNTRAYKQGSGDSLYRRSIYTFWKRTAPHPAMEIFNAPTREVTCVRRERTNTPLQAFVTLNDPQFVEASRQLAGTALKSAPEEQRLDHITERLISRNLSSDERATVMKTLAYAREKFTADPDSAHAFLSVGASSPDPDADAVELAAWTLVTNQILNLDETLTK